LEPTNTLCGWIRTRRDSAGWVAWTVERRAHSREEVAHWKASLGEQARGRSVSPRITSHPIADEAFPTVARHTRSLHRLDQQPSLSKDSSRVKCDTSLKRQKDSTGAPSRVSSYSLPLS